MSKMSGMPIWCYWFCLIVIYCEHIVSGTAVDRKTYEPTWESLDTRPLPKWYDDVKVGIFIHWGVYSVPTFGSEWFWTNWRNERIPSYVDYMAKNFKPGFTYQEFAPQFTAEHFNANEWAKLFEQSGARLIIQSVEHFQLTLILK